MTLLARIKVHSQQICGLAWSPDGENFATGGNDNLCCLFGADQILGNAAGDDDEVITEFSPVSDSQTPASICLISFSHQAQGRIDESSQNLSSPSRSVFSPISPGSASTGNPPASIFSPVSPGSASTVTWNESSEPARFPEQIYPSAVPTLSIGGLNFVPPDIPPSPPQPPVKTWRASAALQTWQHLAAVKAIAFCPWRPHLLATGGGSNDKMIHFFHTTSGAVLATISVSAQVTSLTWSTTHREIAATFGYAQPDHAVRIAVFSWPDCKMVGSVKWDGEHRALFAVPYPGGPSPMSRTWDSSGQGMAKSQRKREGEGCLIVAASDESVKFHEIWSTGRGKSTAASKPGVLGGSDIIEMAEGIDKDGDIIR